MVCDTYKDSGYTVLSILWRSRILRLYILSFRMIFLSGRGNQGAPRPCPRAYSSATKRGSILKTFHRLLSDCHQNTWRDSNVEWEVLLPKLGACSRTNKTSSTQWLRRMLTIMFTSQICQCPGSPELPSCIVVALVFGIPTVPNIYRLLYIQNIVIP